MIRSLLVLLLFVFQIQAAKAICQSSDSNWLTSIVKASNPGSIAMLSAKRKRTTGFCIKCEQELDLGLFPLNCIKRLALASDQMDSNSKYAKWSWREMCERVFRHLDDGLRLEQLPLELVRAPAFCRKKLAWAIDRSIYIGGTNPSSDVQRHLQRLAPLWQ